MAFFKRIPLAVLGQILVVAVPFGLLYLHAGQTLVSDWSSDPNFSHGFLIPPIALYMAWMNRDRLAALRPAPSNWGLAAIGAGMLMHLVGHVGAELFLMRFSMIVTLAGMVLFFWGWQALKVLMVPLAYLVIMIPIPAILWNKIAFPLQLLAAKLSAQMIMLIQIPVFREGNILNLANTSLEVVDACSGLRSLTSLIALTGVFAYLAPLGLLKKWVLFFSSVPIAVVVNVIRLTITAAMAHWISPDTAHGFLHDMSGLVIFAGALGLVYLVFLVELKLETRQKKGNESE
jgi:exosortase